MECIVWAASKARVGSDNEQESSDDDVGEVERDTQNDNGTLLESKKEVLRTVNLADLLVDQLERPEGEQENLHDDNDLDDSNG